MVDGRGAVLLEQRVPTRERARHGHRASAVFRYAPGAFGDQLLDIDLRAGLAGRVDPDEAAIIGIPQKREHVAAHPSHVRLDNV